MHRLIEWLAARRTIALGVACALMLVEAGLVVQQAAHAHLLLLLAIIPLFILTPVALIGWALASARTQAAREAAGRQIAQHEHDVGMLLDVAERLNGAARPMDVFFQVVEVAASALDAYRAAVYINESDHAFRTHVWEQGAWQVSNRVRTLDGTVSGWVIRNGQPYRSNTPETDPRLLQETGEHRQGPRLAVPILGRDNRVLGVLSLSRRENRTPFSAEDLRLAEGISHQAAVGLDRAVMMTRYYHQALHDSLTGLPNRALFVDRLEQALASSRRSEGRVGVFFLDLDGFKRINDTLGHSSGDAVLQEASRRLTASLRPSDTVARFGNDEFTILLATVGQHGDVLHLAERLIAALRKPFIIDHQHLALAASVGATLRQPGEERGDGERLLREADIALQRAKRLGIGQIVFFEPGMGEGDEERLRLEQDLWWAVDRGELRLYYQPEIDFRTRAIVGMEALVRWEHPRLGLLTPASFVPAAEENGLILSIGEWVLREACVQARVWQQLRGDGPPFRMSINLSALQLQQRDLPDQFRDLIAKAGVDPSRLTLEITESAVMQDVGSATATIQALKEVGVYLALDDFGTGYSSLSYLAHFPIDILKIDQSFVRELDKDPTAKGIVEAIIALARTLHMEVTAEGVETEEHRQVLLALGCDHGQGYLFSKPLTSEDMTDFLQSDLSLARS